MSQSDQILDTPHPQSHFVQLYGSDERSLAGNVGRYLSEGLRQGDRLLVIATEAHIDAFQKQIEHLEGTERQILWLDAEKTLARFMRGGQPDWMLFQDAIASVIGDFDQRPDGGSLRAYGEMVGVLWNAGRYAAAIRLEQFWNRLLSSKSFNLYCAYPIDVFSNEFQIAALDALLCAHTHVVPAGKAAELETAINRSMDDLLGRRAEGLRNIMDANFRPAWAVIPKAEANILWLRNNLPEEAESIVARARQYYHVSHPLS